ncbi:MAG: CPBP family intramembrane metalloprotease [Cyanobium sp. NAT70]|nr:CPBP family intramembrane metalloprotease [Cyanobium sp. NAT70]
MLIPVLYGMGWIKAKCLTLIGLPTTSVSIVGTAFSFLLFVVVMPRWILVRWQVKHPWRALGLSGGGREGRTPFSIALVRGLAWALLLLSLIVGPILLGSWGYWLGDWSILRSLNALLLALAVGLAEELIFRGWLWEELNRLLGTNAGILIQAAIFSLIHTRFNLGAGPMLSLLCGLFLLGLILAVRRNLDRGSLWGCIGLHGGLVGGWFLLEKGLLQLSPDVPAWIAGPGGLNPNPLGSGIAITALLVLLWIQRTAFAKAARPDNGARNAC